MLRKQAKKATKIEADNETVILWKATMPLSESEHEELSNKLRFEQENSGVKIVLVPYSVSPEIVEQPKGETITDSIPAVDGAGEPEPEDMGRVESSSDRGDPD
ncbi:hypothetical protein PV433_31005 [Paenibacillus sp. GYB004]|uniref:hypothetical protein n=1 Tax=Paenibacillus sp. GYB004 TaxID=2994393 RepID=UPI002F96A257